ncbi:MAG: hypothetical protein LBT92_01840 [Rickettsiales bacterium]|jgi:hypothetical protein|nr:hypothetical protein [Rickettsiales bacterium]
MTEKAISLIPFLLLAPDFIRSPEQWRMVFMIVACGFWFGLAMATHFVRSYAARAVKLKNHGRLRKAQSAICAAAFPLSLLPEAARGMGAMLFAAPMMAFVRAAAAIAIGAIALKIAEKD